MKILKRILQAIGILVAIFVVYMVVISFVIDLEAPELPLPDSGKAEPAAEAQPPAARQDVRFDVEGTALSAWLYLPEDRSAPVPCIVMGHGFGGTREMGLEPYALRFRDAGFAVLIFDYRHLGASGGEPRQLIWVPNQLEDWAAAIAYARGLEGIDPAKIALWGTSFSGGHVIVTAAQDPTIACAAAQCPFLDGLATVKFTAKRVGIGAGLRMIMHAQRDLVRSWIGLSPHKVPIVGPPESLAFMATADAWEAFADLAPGSFVNEVCARIIIRADKYRPVKHARDVQCPVLLQVCEKDNLLPRSAAEATAADLGDYGELIYYPIGHFDIYTGEDFERSVGDQLTFFSKHLG